MARYDGSIRINTEINSRNASAQLMSLENRIKKYADKISALRSKMDLLKDEQVPTQKYKEINNQIEKAQQKLSKLLEKQERMRNEGKEGGVFWNRLNAQIEETENEILYARQDLQDLIDEGKDFTIGSNTQEYSNLQSQLQYLESDYDALLQRRNEFMQRHNIQPGGYERLENALEELRDSITRIIHPIESMKFSFSSMAASIKEKAAGIAAIIINGIAHPFQTMKTIAGNAIKSTSKLLSGMASVAKKVGIAVKSIVSMLKKATSSMSLFGKSTKGSNNMLQSGFKNLLKYGLGIRSMYVLINKFRTAVKEGFKNLAQYSDPVNQSLSSLKSSLTQLKNSLATAFAPILTAAAPALKALIDMVSRAATMVGMLIASLTGQKTFTKATAVQEDYAASLGDSAKNADKAKKATNGYLSGLDEVRRYEEKEDADSADTGYKPPTPGEMFETVPIESSIADFAKRIKEAWQKADFTEIVAEIGTKLRDALDNIPWDSIQNKAVKIGKSFATLINGFVEVPGLGYTIGKTIGEGINTGIKGINSFLDNTHWDKVGKFIGKGLNGVIDTIDWKGLGHFFAAKWNAVFETIGEAAREFKWKDFGYKIVESINTFIKDFKWEENGAHLGELIKGLLDSLIALLEETNWQELGEKAADFIGAIDWSGIIKRMAEGIGAAIGGLAALIWGFVKDAWQSVVDWWNEKAFEDGKFTITGLLNGILDVLSNIATWLKEHVAIPFLDGFAKAFGLDADGEELFEIGVNIVSGFLNGIVDMIKSIGAWIDEHIFRPFIDGFKNAFGIHSPSTVMQEQGNFIMEGLLNGIAEMIASVVNKFSEIKDKILNKWEEVKKGTKEKWETIKSDLSEKWELIKLGASTAFNGIKNKISEKWELVKTGASTVWNGIKDTLSEKWDNLKTDASGKFENIRKTISDKWLEVKTNTGDKWSEIKTKLSDTWSSLKTNSKDSFGNIKDKVLGAWNKIKSSTTNIWNGIKDAIKTPINAIIGFINKMIEGVVGGINTLTSALNNLSITNPLTDEVIFGFDIPEIKAPKIPALATGAVIPANKEFLAILGDQKHGTNIEAPLSTIEEAAERATERVFQRLMPQMQQQGNRNYTFIGQLNRRVMFEEFMKEADLIRTVTGKNPFEMA